MVLKKNNGYCQVWQTVLENPWPDISECVLFIFFTWLQHALSKRLPVEGVSWGVQKVSQDDGSVHNVPRRQLNRIGHKSVHQRICHTTGKYVLGMWSKLKHKTLEDMDMLGLHAVRRNQRKCVPWILLADYCPAWIIDSRANISIIPLNSSGASL